MTDADTSTVGGQYPTIPSLEVIKQQYEDELRTETDPEERERLKRGYQNLLAEEQKGKEIMKEKHADIQRLIDLVTDDGPAKPTDSAKRRQRALIIVVAVVCALIFLVIVWYMLLQPFAREAFFVRRINTQGVYGSGGVPAVRSEHMAPGVPDNVDIMDMGLAVGMDMPPMMLQQKRANDAVIAQRA